MTLDKRIPEHFSQRAQLAAQTALAAGEVILSYYDKEGLAFQPKGENDIVTAADLASEKCIFQQLRKHYPQDGFIGEESGFTDLEHEFTWVADPLDGTVNFAHGLPDFSISVACMQEDRPLLGAVYVPATDILILAERGKGAYKNSLPLKIRPCPQTDTALIGMDFTRRSYTNLDEHLALYQRILPKVGNIIKPESTVMTTAYCACGRFDAVFEMCPCIWDIAASHVILEEAGATVSDRYGNPIHYDRAMGYSMVAGSKDLHRELIQMTLDI